MKTLVGTDVLLRSLQVTRRLERYFTILPDSALTYGVWRQMVPKYQLVGSKVHGAYLVAAMKTHGVGRILTFNTGDFRRYDDVTPSTLAPCESQCVPREMK